MKILSAATMCKISCVAIFGISATLADLSFASPTAQQPSTTPQHTGQGPAPQAIYSHHPPPNPDLTIKSVWLELPGGLAHVNTVQQGHAYLACFVVANIGSAASGAFRVSGGGLGIPTNPYQDHAGLVPGASRQGCLFYPTTPGPGFYKLGIGADSQHVVNESREDNNDAILPIKVAS